MTQFDSYQHYLSQRQALIDGNAYDPAMERDACGVGVVCSIDGTPRRDVVELAVKALKALFHRGAVDADGKSGDGAGIMINVPQDFFREQVRNIGHNPRSGPVLVGQVFLPRSDLGAQEAARTIVESEILRSGFYLYGWRQPPVDVSQLGQRASATRPEIEQIMMAAPEGLSGEALERAMFLCRRRIEKRVDEANLDCYICSFSAKTLIYKGMFRAELVDDFYLDLKDPRIVSSVAIFHQRFSTNTFPEWRLAQPFRMLAHNGEINTLRGNVNWMKSHEIRMAAATFGDNDRDVKPVIQPRGSDSAGLDNVYELLVRAGRSAPMAKALLIPEAVAQNTTVSDAHKALYAYCNAVMEPWDGPAAICATDGRWVVAGKDRNGLRPLRVAETNDGLLIVGSEAGMTGVSEDRIARRIHIAPGRMIAVDLEEGRLYQENEVVDALSSKNDYKAWLENIIELEPLIAPGPEPRVLHGEELARRQIAAGFTLEDLDTVLDAMVKDGKEAIGSMGDDTPLAVLSEQWRPLAHYFRQNFAQVTNPPIDPLREASGMSLRTRFKNLGNILAEDEAQTNVFVLESPFLTTLMYERMIRFDSAGKVATLDATFALPQDGDVAGNGLRGALERLRDEAVAAAEDGASMIVLTDEQLGTDKIGVPMILAAAAVHSRLVAKGLRSFVSIVVRSSEAMDPHAFAVLVGVGATAINPYLSLELLQERLAQGRYPGLDEHKAFLNYKKAIEAGLMKILAKKGISVISSYRGGYEFEALGLSRALVAEYFPGVTSRISGIGLSGIEQKLSELHAKAFASKRPVPHIGGFYKLRAAGETHYYQPKLIHLLQDATTRDDYETFKTYSGLVAKMSKTAPTSPRDLLAIQPKQAAIAIEEVESVNEIRKRFVTPGMSLGALSPEAHETLNIAMNRIGARSVSGEGGEDPERYQRRPNGDNPNSAIKQIASGRFGVTAEYLNQCQEIEIKVAQGAKPGEGGQLPGFKVTEFIARMRHSTPGVGLISPPPHHDIYSIEDLAQLIYDLKQINPTARVTVKLVSQSGIGAVAAGVAKAKADAILVSGQVGGTGASPLSSIKFAGLPFELGLSEAHQVLTLNNLRGQIRLRADGGMRTGRDIVVAALLGAEEFGIGTASLVAIGCLMVRQCQSNTCPVGVCVQDERLRAKFTGTPEKVINLFTFIATEVREILASLGLRTLQEAVGRTDLLQQISRGGIHLDDLDLNPLLVKVEMDENAIITLPTERNAVADTLDAKIVQDAAYVLQRKEKMTLTYDVRNTMRAIGTRTSSHLVRQFGSTLDEGHLTLELRGSAGQSLGAFAVKGLTINLIGEANDYVGKGLSGATIIVRPKVWHEGQALAGNTILYGATSGKLFVAGSVGERFAVRNSGATTVIEGVGAHGCEYMTGGKVVILGKVGQNFGAGMTGGVAYVYDPDAALASCVNGEGITLRSVPDANVAGLKGLITEHYEKTLSPKAKTLLDDWDNSLKAFVEIMPNEILAIQQKQAKIA
ncbi:MULTISPECIES: glutamate synthase large subunit [Asticcacaulis]|uniref:glutamate synthase large subunit n=1 Tax=Asticcacaulis TaxID=76890 RepID=UPI001AE32B01|nr:MULTISPECIES: glutamate synthase large subunit [Asticcacaulis]MBP2160178.1 glutamate synthase (NADPH/NADH) large chain [Asticcacaulis solisilvae]MDR6801223.1 glutamate synthase (NADPH/NADH) large chain [Asticcacaulis sp. BE141]